MFYGPVILVVLAALVYFFKVKLTEDKHREIVSELEKKLKAEESDAE